MTFDAIVGNPPYQVVDGGYGISATPVYDRFVILSKIINPRYINLIMPARWYAGGKGLDEFRSLMLHDKSIREIHDYPEAEDCFAGVQIKGGICYFLWDRDDKGDCKVVTHHREKISKPMVRPLLENGCDSFIRFNEAISILHKVKEFNEPSMESLVSSRQPFGLPTTYHGKKEKMQGDLSLYENEGLSFVSRSEITKNEEIIDKFKVFIPRASSGSDAFPHPILSKPFLGNKGEVCSETYIFIGPFESEKCCNNVIEYICTRFFRFMAMLKKVTQSTTRSVYTLVPVQDFSEQSDIDWSKSIPEIDKQLYAKYGLSPDEISFIESMIKPME